MTKRLHNPIPLEKLIRNLGIAGTYKGFGELITAVKLAVENEDRLESVTKLLYPEVARLHGTTTDCVQKNYRKVIEVCWRNGGQRRIEEQFGLYYDEKPKTQEFIDMLTNYMRNGR